MEIAATPSFPTRRIIIILNKKVVILPDKLLTISEEPFVMECSSTFQSILGFTK